MCFEEFLALEIFFKKPNLILFENTVVVCSVVILTHYCMRFYSKNSVNVALAENKRLNCHSIKALLACYNCNFKGF